MSLLSISSGMMAVVFLIILFFVLNMIELLKVYRFQFKKREPILVAALSYEEAISRLKKSELYVDDDEKLECISLFQNLEILV